MEETERLQVANRQFDLVLASEVPAGTCPRDLINTIEYALNGILTNVSRDSDDAISVTFEVTRRERFKSRTDS